MCLFCVSCESKLVAIFCSTSHVESEHNTGFDLTSNISRESHSENVCNISRKIGRGWVPDRTSCAFHCDEVVNILLEPFVARLVVREDYCEAETCDKVNGEGTAREQRKELLLSSGQGRPGWAEVVSQYQCCVGPSPKTAVSTRAKPRYEEASRGGC